MNDKLFDTVKNYSEAFGYENVQDFIRETIREKVFDEDYLTPKEIELIERFNKVSEENNIYGSMKDIEKLIEKKKKNEKVQNSSK
jgi:predicted Zn-ribbon and HTH transcriptional regulator